MFSPSAIFASWLGRFTMYRLMLYYLSFLLLFAAGLAQLGYLPYRPLDIILTGAYLLLVCYIANILLARLFGTGPNLESRSITALILTLIVGPLALTPNLWFLTILGVVAMASKYVLAWRKRHIFNPAAFAVVFSALVLGRGASWWVGHEYLILAVLIGGLLMTAKTRRWHLIWAFVLTYTVLLAGQAAVSGNADIGLLLRNVFILSPILFFSFVMLPEPLTGPQQRTARIYYGAFIALLLFFLQTYAPALVYSLELSLIAGNLLTRLLMPDPRLVLRLKRKAEIAAHTLGFWFEPEKALAFTPGQFLEWTLPHSGADSRGVRRYFTIASSPSEDGILLATRLSEKSSSFKRALRELAPGDEVIVSNREGEFVLPPDPKTPLVFIAGGIGITPFRSMIHYLLDRNERRPIVLLYSNRTEGDVAFKDLFDEAAKKLGVKAVYVATEKNGYIGEKLIKQAAPDWQKSLFFVSGPEPMVVAFEKMLSGMGLPSSQIKRDYFPGYEETHQQ